VENFYVDHGNWAVHHDPTVALGTVVGVGYRDHGSNRCLGGLYHTALVDMGVDNHRIDCLVYFGRLLLVFQPDRDVMSI
jgi:chemotaxis receptor (MCP) glutamine deamidase CheD